MASSPPRFGIMIEIKILELPPPSNPSLCGSQPFSVQGTAATLRLRGGATGARGAMPATAPDITPLVLRPWRYPLWNCTATSNYVLVFVCSPGSYQISAATFRLSAWTLRTLSAFPRLTLPWQRGVLGGWNRIGCSASANCILDAFMAFTSAFSRVFPVSATLPPLKVGMAQCQDHNIHPKHLFFRVILDFSGCKWRYCSKHILCSELHFRFQLHQNLLPNSSWIELTPVFFSMRWICRTESLSLSWMCTHWPLRFPFSPTNTW